MMRRIHLFEFEDQAWCPRWLRSAITDMLALIHRWFGTAEIVRERLKGLLSESKPTRVVDLCSGSGGPMVDVVERLRAGTEFNQTTLRLTDLYPDESTVAKFSDPQRPWLSFEPEPTDATTVTAERDHSVAEVRTMICCFHHLRPEQARAVLLNAQSCRVPMLIFEMTDSSVPPKFLWWLAIAPNFIFGLWVAIFTRPMNLVRFVLTFIVPVIPICFAWEGAVSNIRTYNASDIEHLLAPIQTESYRWQVESVKGAMVTHLVITGHPIEDPHGDRMHAAESAIQKSAGTHIY